MKELINSILKAETEAESMINKAKADADLIEQQTNIQVQQIRDSVAKDVKNARRDAASKINEDAQNLYNKRLNAANSQGQALLEKALAKMDEVSDFIIARVIDGNS